MASYYFERTLNMPLEKVWSVIGDFEKSPAPDIPVTVEKHGDPNAGGAGTTRTITIGKVRVREIIDSVDPPRGFTYRILSGAPIRDYFGRVSFEDIAGTTLIRWSVTMKPKIPFTGRICCMVSERVVRQLIDSIEKHHSAS